MIFRINNVDYSGNVIAENYTMNEDDLTKNWTNANEVKKAKFVRTKVKGSFQMFFKTVSDYEDFLADMAAAKNASSRAYECGVAINFPLNTFKTINADLKLTPARALNGTYSEYFKQFTVNVEER